MTTAIFSHESNELHEDAPAHPEQPARLSAIINVLATPIYEGLVRISAPRASVEQIARVHDRAYVEALLAKVPAQGYVMLDPDTGLSPGSGEAALHAAGALVAAVDGVMEGKFANAFCAVRPPGHHAERTRAMGFCFFNNVAIGAAHAIAAHGVERIAIVDFDVHHGNGTQEWTEGQDGVLFASTHQFPCYPGTGRAQDQGPRGNIVNVPLPPGTDGAGFRAAMQSRVLPALRAFAPQFLFISAGFDAHRDDPLADLRLEAEDFGWATRELAKIARESCGGRIVSTLEGGYDLQALAACVEAHVKALMAS